MTYLGQVSVLRLKEAWRELTLSQGAMPERSKNTQKSVNVMEVILFIGMSKYFMNYYQSQWELIFHS